MLKIMLRRWNDASPRDEPVSVRHETIVNEYLHKTLSYSSSVWAALFHCTSIYKISLDRVPSLEVGP